MPREQSKMLWRVDSLEGSLYLPTIVDARDYRRELKARDIASNPPAKVTVPIGTKESLAKWVNSLIKLRG